MSAIEEQSDAERFEGLVKEIHEEWKALRAESTSGQKAWLRQMNAHYTRIVQADPEAAAELLASYEFTLLALRKAK